MVAIKNNVVSLRALEPEDLDFLYKIENDTSIWEVSHTQAPYSRFVLKQYLSNAHKDIYEAKQLRLAICNEQQKHIGLIDLYDFDARHRRAGVGIIIAEADEQGKGYGRAALQLLIDYAFKHLQLHQLHACIAEDNERSIRLFKSLGFELCGTQRDWLLSEGAFKSQLLFQKINS